MMDAIQVSYRNQVRVIPTPAGDQVYWFNRAKQLLSPAHSVYYSAPAKLVQPFEVVGIRACVVARVGG